MTCRELIEFLSAYLADELPADQRCAFNLHLDRCPPCLAYLRTYQETIRLGRCACEPADADITGSVPEELIDAILAARHKRGEQLGA